MEEPLIVVSEIHTPTTEYLWACISRMKVMMAKKVLTIVTIVYKCMRGEREG